jgi:hypothetical protein
MCLSNLTLFNCDQGPNYVHGPNAFIDGTQTTIIYIDAVKYFQMNEIDLFTAPKVFYITFSFSINTEQFWL